MLQGVSKKLTKEMSTCAARKNLKKKLLDKLQKYLYYDERLPFLLFVSF